MNKRIKKKHFTRFANGVMYFRYEGDEWCAYEKAKPFKGRDGRRLYQYAMESGHTDLSDDVPEFNPRSRYVFSVEVGRGGGRFLTVERV